MRRSNSECSLEQGDRARLDKARDVYLDSTWCSLQQGGAQMHHHLNTIPLFHLVIRVLFVL